MYNGVPHVDRPKAAEQFVAYMCTLQENAHFGWLFASRFSRDCRAGRSLPAPNKPIDPGTNKQSPGVGSVRVGGVLGRSEIATAKCVRHLAFGR